MPSTEPTTRCRAVCLNRISMVYINSDSGLQKLMRAARRGKIPPERQVIIDTAMRKAAQRG